MSQPEPITEQQLRQHFHACLTECGDERKAARRALAALTESDRDALKALGEEVRFEVRCYGPGQFFVWPVHELFRRWPVDPWPASRYPRDNLMLELALRDPRRRQQ